MSTFQAAMAAVFWACAGLIFYAYAVYPILIWLLSRSTQAGEAPPLEPDKLPFVSLLIAAYNEEAVIEERINNALALNYPRDRLEIVIGVDGCTDATADTVRRYAEQGVRLLDFAEHRGKSSVLNASMDRLQGTIVLLSDANTQIDPEAPGRLVRWFQRPEVGVVCGRLILTDPRSGRNVDSLYWKYETFIKKCEGRLGALLGANGAIYSIRKTLYQPVPSDTIIDDFVIPLLMELKWGCKIIYDPTAVAREETPPEMAAEFRRRTRIGAGDYQSIGMLWRLLDPRRGWVAFAFLSHKFLRWFCPFFMIGMIISNMLLLGQSAFPPASAVSAQFLPGGDAGGVAAFVGPRLETPPPHDDVHEHEPRTLRRLLALGRETARWSLGTYGASLRVQGQGQRQSCFTS